MVLALVVDVYKHGGIAVYGPVLDGVLGRASVCVPGVPHFIPHTGNYCIGL